MKKRRQATGMGRPAHPGLQGRVRRTVRKLQVMAKIRAWALKELAEGRAKGAVVEPDAPQTL